MLEKDYQEIIYRLNIEILGLKQENIKLKNKLIKIRNKTLYNNVYRNEKGKFCPGYEKQKLYATYNRIQELVEGNKPQISNEEFIINILKEKRIGE